MPKRKDTSQTGPEKDRSLQVRMEGHERDVVDELARHYGVTTSQFVRTAIDYIVRTQPTLLAYPIATDEDEARFAHKPERGWLQLRIAGKERKNLEAVAADYGLDSSKFVRVILGYFREKRPPLELVPSGKDYALVAVAA